MNAFEATIKGPERCVLVGADLVDAARPLDDSMQELGQLAETAGLVVVGTLVQALKRVHPATFIGQGKVEDVKATVGDVCAEVVIFDDPLSPAQQRNLEKAIGCKVIDRAALILDIFAQRARSLEGRLQVELAQLQYLMPRLTRQWTHLSRQAGGGVGLRGPGETQLEVDRRRIRERIGQLKTRLRDVERTRLLHRQDRAAVPYPTIALVGYTNAGKSTLMNALTRAGVLAEDKLFATLDPTTRRVRLPGGLPALLIDTVGFIHKLPHQLVEAFRSTLEQVSTADLVVHVIDVAHPAMDEHVGVVSRVLEEIGAGERPRLAVFNKIDALGEASVVDGIRDGVAVSARNGTGLDRLMERMAEELSRTLVPVRRRFAPDQGNLVAWLKRNARVLEEQHDDQGTMIVALASPKVAGQLAKRVATLESAGC